MLDSGVRRGTDVIVALCLGARAVTFGRPTLYGAAAGGRAGVRKAIEIMRREVDIVMAQIGCTSLKELGPANLHEWPLNGEFLRDELLRRDVDRVLNVG
jgi:(S)-mandelate dehydrogenase